MDANKTIASTILTEQGGLLNRIRTLDADLDAMESAMGAAVDDGRQLEVVLVVKNEQIKELMEMLEGQKTSLILLRGNLLRERKKADASVEALRVELLREREQADASVKALRGELLHDQEQADLRAEKVLADAWRETAELRNAWTRGAFGQAVRGC